MRLSSAMLLLGLVAMPGAASQDEAAPINLRVIAHATMDSADLDRTRETAAALLATGGLRSNWRECAGACGTPSDDGPTVTILLLPIAKLNDDGVCGESTRDGLTQVPTVLVYVRSIVDRVRAIHRSPAGRSHPSLSTLQIGHLAGIAIAHEVGHTLGLGHAPAGVMKARLGTGDVLEWRRSGLTFGQMERTAMRATLVSKLARRSRVP